MYNKSKIFIDGAIAILAYLLTMASMPFAGSVFPKLEDNMADPFLNKAISLSIGLVFLGVLIYLMARKKEIRAASYLWFFAFLAISILLLTQVRITKDRIHLFMYFVLCVLIYRTLRHAVGTNMLYAYSAASAMIFGVLDETMQLSGWGGRSFEFKDIGFDCAGAMLAVSFIALVIRPKLEAAEISIRRRESEPEKINAFVKKHAAERVRSNPQKFAEQICLVFKKKTSRTGGHVHFKYKGKKDSIILICDNLSIEDILAKNEHCAEGRFISWSTSDFSRFSPKTAFLAMLDRIEFIEIDDPSIQKSWSGLAEFQNWLNETIVS